MTTHEYLLNKYGTTLSFKQASEETGIYWQTIRGMCLRGEIKTPRNGRLWVLTTKALAEYLDNGPEKTRGPVTATENTKLKNKRPKCIP